MLKADCYPNPALAAQAQLHSMVVPVGFILACSGHKALVEPIGNSMAGRHPRRLVGYFTACH